MLSYYLILPQNYPLTRIPTSSGTKVYQYCGETNPEIVVKEPFYFYCERIEENLKSCQRIENIYRSFGVNFYAVTSDEFNIERWKEVTLQCSIAPDLCIQDMVAEMGDSIDTAFEARPPFSGIEPHCRVLELEVLAMSPLVRCVHIKYTIETIFFYLFMLI